ncbi:hypothetical protein [Actinoplanes auranticolor]|uniref:Uncharacterized protein n=1 Tax=Actinoplanes auranticolor TaxID=47988 RepID=A0A919S2X2_9ACTN|nr:hypothetical protein [Actinoplanes auranticolor]GIM62993.1 hypothetical protein Aau02nite_01190 [Actinoplanes auranticolor]
MHTMSPARQDQMRAELNQLVQRWARQLDEATPDDDGQADASATPDPAARRRSQLARMTAGEHMRELLAGLIAKSAADATLYGAGYPELGEAVGISRQAARKRWPHLAAALGGRRARSWKQPPGGVGWATDSSLGYPGG